MYMQTKPEILYLRYFFLCFAIILCKAEYSTLLHNLTIVYVNRLFNMTTYVFQPFCTGKHAVYSMASSLHGKWIGC